MADHPVPSASASRTWAFDAARPRTLVSPYATPVNFPATGDPVTIEEACANRDAVLLAEPWRAGSPLPWAAKDVDTGHGPDWIVLDARRHVVVQCGRGDVGREIADLVVRRMSNRAIAVSRGEIASDGRLVVYETATRREVCEVFVTGDDHERAAREAELIAAALEADATRRGYPRPGS